MNLDLAEKISFYAFSVGKQNGLNPLTITVLDSGGNLKLFKKQDGSSLFRYEISRGKAYGALGLGLDSAELLPIAKSRPEFMTSAYVSTGGFVPVPGGVLVKKKSNGEIIGAVGVSGDLSEKDEACIVEAIRKMQEDGENVTCNKIIKGTPPVLQAKL
eukprot:augustus_masked-scaffold_13-processed-gene-8.24-mRNA-1 protein AED:0.02 eAED:0.02 QI:0/-1/0/1/-1/1/1/0/157